MQYSKSLALLAVVGPALVFAQGQCSSFNGTELLACQQQAAFGGSSIVPSVIPTFNPVGSLTVEFDGLSIGAAQQLQPSQAANTPTLGLQLTNTSTEGNQYLIAMIDPDAPTPEDPSRADILHWLAGNFTAAQDGVLSNSSAALAPYGSPNPPAGSNPHRYILVLYQQPDNFIPPAAVQNLTTTIGGARVGFNFTDFVTAAGLGDPIAGNFFKAGPTGSASSSSGSSSSAGTSTSAGSRATSTGASQTSAGAAGASSSTPASSTSGAAHVAAVSYVGGALLALSFLF